MTTTRVLLGVLLGAGAAGAALLGAAGWRAGVQNRSAYTDGDRIRVPAPDAPLRDVLWQPAEPVPGSDSADQYEPRISADGGTMVFVRGLAGGTADLYTCRRTPTGWSDPVPVAALNTEHDELGPELSSDGRSLYFCSDRPGGLGGYDVWISTRESDASEAQWGGPVNVGPAVNTPFDEYGPARTPDGARLYFSSNRPRPGEPRAQRDAWTATIREEHSRHDYDLYRCDLQPAGWTPAVAVVELNTVFDEGAPALSPPGDFLYFASDRPGGMGGFDVYRSRVLRSRVLAPENLGAAVNSTANDLDPAPSMDGFRLCFSSDRTAPAATETAAPPPEAVDASTEASRYALWASGSREVFLEVDPLRAGELLSRIWGAAWLWLLLLLLLALLGGLFFALLRDATFRRRLGQLSLMAKCLFISLLIHSMLLSLLAVWRVGSALGDAFASPGGGGTHVSIASLGSGGVAAQVRGPLAEMPIESPRLATLRPSTPTLDLPAPHITLTALPAPTNAPLPRRPPPVEESAPRESSPPSIATPPSLSIVASPPAPESAAAPDAVSEAHLDLSAAATIPPASQSPVPAAPAGRVSVSVLPERSAIPEVVGQRSALPLSDAAPSVSDPAVPPTFGVPALPVSTMSTGAARTPQAAPRDSAVSEPSLAQGPPSQLPAALPAANRQTTVISATRVSLLPGVASLSSLPGNRPDLPIADSASTSTQPPAGVPVASNLGAVPAPTSNTSAARIPGESAPERIGPSDRAQADVHGNVDRVAAGAVGTSPRPAVPAMAPGAAPSVHLDPASGSKESHLQIPASDSAFKPFDSSSSAISSRTPALEPRTIVPGPAPAGLSARLPEVEEEPSAPAEVFAQRDPELRAEVLERTGGSPETERAVGRALEWFRAHQSRDGRWSGRHFDDGCGRCGGAAEIESDAAMTGLALLCFLSAGHTHTADGPHRDAVRSALTWLVQREDAAGDLRRGETMYSQTIAAVALCEAYGMTRDPWLEAPARRAVTFVARGPARRQGGDPDESDTSVLGWQIMALKSAERCGFAVPGTGMADAARWLDRVSSQQSPGRYGYRPGGAPGAAATAEAMFVRQLLGHGRDEASMQDAARFILATPPAWRRGAPTYYWYYATLALFQHQGDSWREWNTAVSKELLANQHREGPAAGSWDPQDEWSQLGGRIYQTAVCTLSLEVYYRYRVADRAP